MIYTYEELLQCLYMLRRALLRNIMLTNDEIS